jgi:hypothetical protein
MVLYYHSMHKTCVCWFRSILDYNFEEFTLWWSFILLHFHFCDIVLSLCDLFNTKFLVKNTTQRITLNDLLFDLYCGKEHGQPVSLITSSVRTTTATRTEQLLLPQPILLPKHRQLKKVH